MPLNLHQPTCTAPSGATEALTADSRPNRKRRPPLLLKRKAAAQLCGFSLATWDRMSAAGLNPLGLKIGGAKMYRTAELRAWVRHNCLPRKEWAALWKMLQTGGVKR